MLAHFRALFFADRQYYLVTSVPSEPACYGLRRSESTRLENLDSHAIARAVPIAKRPLIGSTLGW
jgi:hypothetical protein